MEGGNLTIRLMNNCLGFSQLLAALVRVVGYISLRPCHNLVEQTFGAGGFIEILVLRSYFPTFSADRYWI